MCEFLLTGRTKLALKQIKTLCLFSTLFGGGMKSNGGMEKVLNLLQNDMSCHLLSIKYVN